MEVRAGVAGYAKKITKMVQYHWKEQKERPIFCIFFLIYRHTPFVSMKYLRIV